MDKPLVALLTNNDDDVYCFRLELIQAIIAVGCNILISCPDGPKFEVMQTIGLRKNQEFIYDDPPIDRRGTSVVNDGKLMMHYWKLFSVYRPDVVLTYTAKPNVYASLIAHKFHIPVINNVTGLGSVLNESYLKKKLILGLFKLAYNRSACIMFQNRTNLELAKKLEWIKGNYRLIPGSGVSFERYPVQKYPNGGDGVNGDPIIFNYIGRIMKDKGVDDYIKAAKEIKKMYPNTEFNIIGFIEPTEDHYVAELDELCKQKIVIYRGPQKDVKPWIKRAHAIIHPSTYGEGISNVLLENASSARLIITTDNPGCKETVNDGVSGFIYHGGNLAELIKKIENVILMENEKRENMGLEGRKKVELEFNRKNVIKEYLSCIIGIVGKGECL